MKANYDVAVIGLGIMGAATHWRLSLQGSQCYRPRSDQERHSTSTTLRITREAPQQPPPSNRGHFPAMKPALLGR